MGPDHAEISNACLTHLRREEEVLAEALTLLDRVHQALVRGDLQRLETLRTLQDAAVERSATLRRDRDRLRQRLGSFLQVSSSSLTLELLAGRLPGPDGLRVRQAGDRVRRLAERVAALTRDNAVLIEHGLDFIRRFLLDVTGGGLPAGRYGPDGSHLEAAFGSLLSARG